MKLSLYAILMALVAAPMFLPIAAAGKELPDLDDDIGPDIAPATIYVCPAYNPNAFSNACIVVGWTPTAVDYPVPQPNGSFCVISYYCVPMYTLGSNTIMVIAPEPHAWVEFTQWCTIMNPCRFGI